MRRYITYREVSKEDFMEIIKEDIQKFVNEFVIGKTTEMVIAVHDLEIALGRGVYKTPFIFTAVVIKTGYEPNYIYCKSKDEKDEIVDFVVEQLDKLW